MATEQSVRSVERAMKILNCFIENRDGLALADIARSAELPANTTLRIINSLVDGDFLYKDDIEKKYYLGSQVFKLGNIPFSTAEIVNIAHPFLEELVSIYDESTGIYIVRNDRRVVVDRVNGNQTLRNILRIGESAPLSVGSVGRVLLSGMSDEKASRFLDKNSPTSIKDVQDTRKKGYAVSYEERSLGIASVAAPILNARGEVVAALFITVPTVRMTKEMVNKLIPVIVDTGKEISHILGYR